MPELPEFIVRDYVGARVAGDGVNWIAVRPLLFGGGRIVRGPIENAWAAGVPDGW